MKRSEIDKYVGNLLQAGGCRHLEYTDGLARNMRAIQINTGSGLQYTVLPDRGMDISLANFKGTNLIYITPNGETHPGFYEPEGIGWLRTFSGGLLTTCGLTYLGAPAKDGNEELGLHGRYSTIPAHQVNDLSGWDNETYKIRIKGIVEEASLFGNKLRLVREITSDLGRNKITISDTITNFGSRPSPVTIMYHMNFGYPFLDENIELHLNPVKTVPRDEIALAGINEYRKFSMPYARFEEQVFFHTLGDENGKATVSLINKLRGIKTTIQYNINELPCFTQWKMMGYGEYVLGLEPGNVFSKSRDILRNEGSLPFLEPNESIEKKITISVEDI